ncbi:MAG: 3'(2'),5'-bisphosphate nucleotidase CysQ [Alphaproteobacteria bacterium]|nr:3'(2'),5'-bisphosphate nucleotidase CysQ [Alphaproteobacteria bacterium]
MTDLLEQARALLPCALAAGARELAYFREGTEVIDKADGSPVTRADREAEEIISKALADLFPHIPMVGEESVAAGVIPDISGGTFWLVDPLDGTKEFITGSGDFTVNIALMEDFTPVMGVIYAPVADTLYFGAAGKAFIRGQDGVEKRISVRAAPPEGLTVVASKRHGDPAALEDFLKGKKVAEVISRSSSLKFCSLAAGEADFYPRLGPTCEWDTAAGEAVLRAAGGRVATLEDKPFLYGKITQKFLNPGFMAFGAG